MSPDELIALCVGAGLLLALACLVVYGVLRGAEVQHQRDVAGILAAHDAAARRRAIINAHRDEAR